MREGMPCKSDRHLCVFKQTYARVDKTHACARSTAPDARGGLIIARRTVQFTGCECDMFAAVRLRRARVRNAKGDFIKNAAAAAAAATTDAAHASQIHIYIYVCRMMLAAAAATTLVPNATQHKRPHRLLCCVFA